ncbi:sensor histidine kinase [Nordella sp. HKS 07]|uniref:sensor histidine kinase n=1 Tax=Nordella sp. HKS 07 TaxID=2712222 RepID=UPI0013E200AD|nr:ATP-binding protein [Nordella sp. HKS 07]QIG50300.1 sensor histidine kinase [Nordella sp. HKS 07]
MTRRLILWLTAATILYWLAAAGFGVHVMRGEFDEVFDTTLQETAQRLLPLLNTANVERDDSLNLPHREEYLTYQLRTGDGRVLLRSHDAPAAAFTAPLEPGFHDTPNYRIYTEADTAQGLFLQVADPLDHRREAAAEGSFTLILPMLLLAPLSIIAIWFIVWRALAPIAVLRDEIGRRDGTNLAALAPGKIPPELKGIVASVDRLLERLRAALAAEREFAANSAHELRTPIAGALAQTQRLLAELPEGSARKRAFQIEASLSALGRLAEKLLQLARAEAGIGSSADEVDLLPVVRLVVSDFQRSQPSSGRLHLADSGGAELICRVDVDAFAMALRNLIENALLHGDGGEVRISFAPPGTISVVNGGKIVPAHKLQGLRQRFKRGETTGDGSGLGLAIAEMLVRQMGWRLELLSPASGRRDGFEARLIVGKNL